MTQASDHGFDDFAPEADAVEQHTPLVVDEDEETTLDSVRRISTDADEADLIEQAMVVPTDDDLEFDR